MGDVKRSPSPTAPFHSVYTGRKLGVLKSLGSEFTWQVDEGTSGRRAAVGDGEGHGINTRGQVVNIQREVGVGVCGEKDG